MPTRFLIGISATQGLLMLWLNRRFEENLWPVETPTISWPMFALLVFLPLLVLLSANNEKWKLTVGLCSGFTLILMLLSAFAGSQSGLPAEVFNSGHLVSFSLAMWIATFISASFIQHAVLDGRPFHYQNLFKYSWRNFLIPSFACLFTLFAWLLLMLWAALFELLNIEFFDFIFNEDWFLIPFLFTVFGVGVITFRELTRILDNVTHLLRGLIRILLPLVTFISVTFLAALIFTGPTVVWESNIGSILLLWLIAITLFGCNAVYQNGVDDNVYPKWVHRFIALGLVVLPVYVGLSLYGLMERIDQYGLSLSRLYGLLVWLVLSLFVMGYVFSIVRRRDAWIGGLAKTNTAMAFIIVALLMTTHSPLLDLKRFVISNQLNRLAFGEVTTAEFDIAYFYYQLAEPGREALDQLKLDYQHDADFVARLMNPVRQGYPVSNPQNPWQEMVVRPAGLEVPNDLQGIIKRRLQYDLGEVENYVFGEDLTADGKLEYMLFQIAHKRVVRSEVYVRSTEGRWSIHHLRNTSFDPYPDDAAPIENGKIELLPSKFAEIKIGDLRYQVMSGSAGIELISPGLPMQPGNLETDARNSH